MLGPIRPPALFAWTVALLAFSPRVGVAQSVDFPPACQQGRITRIDIRNGDVFSPSSADPQLLRWFYQAANQLHVRTRADFVKKALLFDEGDCFDPYLLAESEQVLNGFSFLRNASITHKRENADNVVVEVDTQDEWTTQANVGMSYDERLNLEWFGLSESNLVGHGIGLSATRHQFREDHSQSVSLVWPHLIRHTFLRSDYSTSRSGTSYGMRFSRPFVGDEGRHSFQFAIDRSADFFSYGVPAGNDYSHLLIPLLVQSSSVQYGRRFGTSRRALVLGFRLERQDLSTRGTAEYVIGNNFETTKSSTDLSDAVRTQLTDPEATRLSFHIGVRANEPARMVGLDGVHDVQSVANGYLVALAAGRTLNQTAYSDDGFLHFDAAIAKPVHSSYVRAGLYLETDYARADWSDVLAGADVIAYGRARWWPAQTLFFRASGAGGWRTTVPFQLTLGGPDGVRSLRDDALPGGRRLVLTLEDRIAPGWPDLQAADLGLTLLADAGKTWAGDVPFGLSSDWQGSAGFGLRIGVPRGSQFTWRPDLVFPVGRRGAPVFRITMELNSLRRGIATDKLLRSMRFNRGIESF